jgi:acetyl-CoA C-acetyltransferase
VIADPDSAQATVREDIGGAKVAVTADGSATLQ